MAILDTHLLSTLTLPFLWGTYPNFLMASNASSFWATLLEVKWIQVWPIHLVTRSLPALIGQVRPSPSCRRGAWSWERTPPFPSHSSQKRLLYSAQRSGGIWVWSWQLFVPEWGAVTWNPKGKPVSQRVQWSTVFETLEEASSKARPT